MTEAEYFTQEYEEDGDMSDWQDYSIEGATEVTLLRKRIAELEAESEGRRKVLLEKADTLRETEIRLMNVEAQTDTAQATIDALLKRCALVERQRDDLAAALREIQSNPYIDVIFAGLSWKQIAEKMGGIAADALARLEGEAVTDESHPDSAGQG